LRSALPLLADSFAATVRVSRTRSTLRIDAATVYLADERHLLHADD
jgi:hypothetical protein